MQGWIVKKDEVSIVLLCSLINAELTPETIEFLGNKGYEPVYGARPLKRAIQKYLLDELSLQLLEGKFKDGDTIEGRVENDSLVFVV